MSNAVAINHSAVPTAPRRDAFLEALRRCGTIRAAARAITPDDGDGKPYRDPSSAWYDLRRRDPSFAMQVAAAEGDFIANLEQYALKFATGGLTTPKFNSDGVKIADVPVVDNASARVLLRLLSRFSPHWEEHKNINVAVAAPHDGGHIKISVNDYSALSPAQQSSLSEIIETIRASKANLIDNDPRAANELSPEDQRQLDAYHAGLALSPADAAMLAEVCR
jgi:hypothetical protein